MLDGGELALDTLGVGHAGGTVGGGGVGAAAGGLIDDVDGVAAADEVFGPAFAAIRGAEEIAAVLEIPVDHHQGVWVGLVSGDLVFDEHLPGDAGAVGGAGDAGVEKPFMG